MAQEFQPQRRVASNQACATDDEYFHVPLPGTPQYQAMRSAQRRPRMRYYH
jgi:hypothetical protein